MNPCHVCSKPTNSFRSLTMLTAPPAGPHDSVPICPACDEHWTFALAQNLHADLALQTSLPIPTATRNTPHKHL